MSEATVGIDIGTTSVKAVAADADGTVLARARVPHQLLVPGPDHLEHDIDQAWRAGVRDAYAQVSAGLTVRAANIAAMVPSLGAVDADGNAMGPGLLYGDARGRTAGRASSGPGDSGELLAFLGWLVEHCPGAAGFWPAQAAANHALSGRGAIDSTTAVTAYPLFDLVGWDAELVAGAGLDDTAKLPDVVSGVEPVGRIVGTEVLLGGGTIDALAEQLVAGADSDGDVLVICGTTLITWAVMDDYVELPGGGWTIPHTAPGKSLFGGPSNAGGLFLNWARALAGEGGDDSAVGPRAVPVWLPYVRGERTPLNRNDLRARLCDLDLTHGPAELRRAAYEAAAFVVRHHLDLLAGKARPRRIVATGGGVRVEAWVQALADGTGLPVDIVAVPEGGALGSAFIARCVAGLETSMTDASRWARTARTVEPDPRWVAPCAERYARFRQLTTEATAGP
ncbi:MAG: xylulokinase [Acidimicrobiales bacterium]